MAKGCLLPIQNANHLALLGMEQHIPQTKVFMRDHHASVIGRKVIEQSGNDFVQGGNTRTRLDRLLSERQKARLELRIGKGCKQPFRPRVGCAGRSCEQISFTQCWTRHALRRSLYGLGPSKVPEADRYSIRPQRPPHGNYSSAQDCKITSRNAGFIIGVRRVRRLSQIGAGASPLCRLRDGDTESEPVVLLTMGSPTDCFRESAQTFAQLPVLHGKGNAQHAFRAGPERIARDHSNTVLNHQRPCEGERAGIPVGNLYQPIESPARVACN